MKNYQQKAVVETKDRKLKVPAVTEYMTPAKKLITFHPDTNINDVVNSLLSNRVTGAPVLNEKNEVVGLIDDKDCLNVLVGSAYYNHPTGQDTAADYMSNVMKSITTDENIIDVANIFLQEKYKRLLVLDDQGKLVGQISRRDILFAIKDLNASTW